MVVSSQAHALVDVLASGLAGARITWVGAASFEDRCVGSARLLASVGATVRSALILDYPTVAEPRGHDRLQRVAHLRELQQALTGLVEFGAAGDIATRVLHPYRLSEIRQVLTASWKRARGADLLVVDVSCLTKAHTLGLASWICEHPDAPVVVAYSQPEQYLSPARHLPKAGRWAAEWLLRSP